MKKSLVLIPFFLSIAPEAFARAETCQTATVQDIAALFDRWNESLKSGNVQKIVSNYSEKSILLPSLSNTPRLTAESKKEYFEQFLKQKPVGKIDSRFIQIDCNTALDTGLYNFTLNDGKQIRGRYTFTYKWDGKQWLITSHHSSIMPEQPIPASIDQPAESKPKPEAPAK